MTESNGTTMNWGVFILGFLLFVIIFNGGLFGNRAEALSYGTCRDASNCDVEKQTIINTATTQNLINTQAEATRAQASRIYEAQQSEKLFDLKLESQTRSILNGQALMAKDNEIAILKTQIHNDAKFNAIQREIEVLSCESLKRPPVWGCGATPCSQSIISGCGTTV